MACFVIESNTILSWNCSLVNFGKEINFISNVTIVENRQILDFFGGQSVFGTLFLRLWTTDLKYF